MKILFLSRLFYPHIGGVEKHVMEVGKKLVIMGYKVTVITEENGKREKVEGIEVYRIPLTTSEKFKKFQIWWWLWKNRNLIRQVDLVHAHDVGFWYFPFRFLFPKKPFYLTFHGYEQYPPTKRAILIRKISEKISFANICVGDYIPKWYGTKANCITYGGVEMLPILQTNTNNKNILFIGRLDEQTGIMTYLQAFKKYQLLATNYHLLILGDGPLKRKADNFIRNNKLEAKILGFVANPEKYLQEARFAFVSRYLSILEAMVGKRLVFATYDNPLKEDYLKLSPFSKQIVIEDSPEALYNKLVYYIQHPKEEKKKVEEAYNWAKEQTWEKMVNLYLKLWRAR